MTPPDSSPIHSFPPKLSLRETLVKVLLLYFFYKKKYEQLLKVKNTTSFFFFTATRLVIKNYYIVNIKII